MAQVHHLGHGGGTSLHLQRHVALIGRLPVYVMTRKDASPVDPRVWYLPGIQLGTGKLTTLFRENLVFQFSVVSFAIMAILALGISTAIHKQVWVSVSTIGVSFVTLYLALVSIVWTGWRTITEQRRRLESFNATLEDQVQDRTSELGRANSELADEVSERRRAEEERTQRTLELEKALQELRSTHRQLTQSAKLAGVLATSESGTL